MLITSEENKWTTLRSTIYAPFLPKYNRKGTGFYFPIGSKEVRKILQNMLITYKFIQILLYSLKLSRKQKVLKKLGYLWHMHTRNYKLEIKNFGNSSTFSVFKKTKSTIKCLSSLKHKGPRYNQNNNWRKPNEPAKCETVD